MPEPARRRRTLHTALRQGATSAKEPLPSPSPRDPRSGSGETGAKMQPGRGGLEKSAAKRSGVPESESYRSEGRFVTTRSHVPESDIYGSESSASATEHNRVPESSRSRSTARSGTGRSGTIRSHMPESDT